MNLLQLVQLAVQVYLKNAYPHGAPADALEKAEKINSFDTDADLLAWPGFEVEDGRYHLRLGNYLYPHMKLVFLLEDRKPLFYADAHDSHFNLPPGLPDYDKILALRKNNLKMKQIVEMA